MLPELNDLPDELILQFIIRSLRDTDMRVFESDVKNNRFCTANKRFYDICKRNEKYNQ